MRTFAVFAVAALLLCVVRPALCQQDTDSSARVSEFADWLYGNGVKTTGFTIEKNDNGPGYRAVAAVPLSKGSEIAHIPRGIALRLDSPHTDFVAKFPATMKAWREKFASASEIERQLLSSQALAGLAFYERFYKPSSFWAPMWGVFPLTFENLPTSGVFNQDERTLLNAIPELATASASVRQALELTLTALEADLVRPHPEVFGPITAQTVGVLRARLEWAFYSLQTRSYSPRRPGDEMAIVPLADLFNHNGALASAPLMWAESEAHKTDPTVPIDHYVVVASKDDTIAAGEEVFASFVSNRCNADLLAVFGFVEPSSPLGDCARFSLTAPVSSLSAADANTVLNFLREQKLVGDDNAALVVLRRWKSDSQTFDRAMTMLRVAELAAAGQLSSATATKAVQDGFVSIENELAATRRMRFALLNFVTQAEGTLARWASAVGAQSVGTNQRGEQIVTVTPRTRTEQNMLTIVEGSIRACTDAITKLEAKWDAFLDA